MKEWKVKKNEFGEEWHELRFSPFYEDEVHPVQKQNRMRRKRQNRKLYRPSRSR